jgi:hypothetical protein
MFVSLLDADIVIAILHIEFGEDLSSTKVREEVGNQGEGVLIANCDVVDTLVILYWSQLAVFLLYKEER